MTVTRREVLRGLAALSALPALPAAAATWRNWSGSQQVPAADLVFPVDEAGLVDAVRGANAVRAVGGGHSFNPVVNTSGRIVSLEAMTGLVSLDAQNGDATFWAGTRLFAASHALAGAGRAFAGEPDINLQSLGGAVSTATHGTGRGLPCMSAELTGLRLVTAAGDLLDCNGTENREVFEAARVAVGCLGILSQLRFRTLPGYRLRETVRVMNLESAMAWVDAHKDEYRHIEFLAFMAADKAIVQWQHPTTNEPTAQEPARFDENRVLDWAARSVVRAPWLNPWLQRLVGAFVTDHTRVDEAHRIFPKLRGVPFNETEYQVPAEHGMACLAEVRHAMRRSGEAVFFPVEFRYVKGDDLWLSPFHGRDSVSISVHRYHRQDHRPLFAQVEPVFARYGGRPHWGKLHTLRAPQLRDMYPRWGDFLRVRAQLDPHGKFLNRYMRDVLGV